MIQPLILLNQGAMNGPGSSFSDPTIQHSELAAVFKRTFDTLNVPPGLLGSVKLQQRRDNPDLFDIYFLCANDFGTYTSGSSYSSVDQIRFERSEFEQFSDQASACQRKLDTFSEQLINGRLRRGAHEDKK
jgi:hypothetical protein